MTRQYCGPTKFNMSVRGGTVRPIVISAPEPVKEKKVEEVEIKKVVIEPQNEVVDTEIVETKVIDIDTTAKTESLKSKEQNENLICSICSKMVKSNFGLMAHMRLAHK